MMRILLGFLIGLTAFGQNPAPVFNVSGILLDAGNKPARGMRVWLWESATRLEKSSLWTGADGRFAFRVPAGKYTLHAERLGFLRQTYGSGTSADRIAVAIITGPGLETGNIVFRLGEWAAISGRVVDEAGDPVENAVVYFLRSDPWSEDGPGPVGVRQTRANDKGEYYSGYLSAGTYFLLAAGPTSGEAGANFAPLFYPNAADSRYAVPISLVPGQSFAADFVLRQAPAAKLQVKWKEGSKGSTQVTLVPADENFVNLPLRSAQSWTNSIELAGVVPGRYSILLRNGDAVGSGTVTMGAVDASVSVDMQAPVAVSGQFTGSGLNVSLFAELTVRLLRPGYTFSAKAKADGTFVINRVVPGRYRLWVNGAPDLLVGQVLADGKRVPTAAIEIGTAAPPPMLVVSVRNDAARVRGILRRSGDATAGTTVVLAPVEAPKDLKGYWRFKTDSDGSFTFEAVREGMYRIFALTSPATELGHLPSILALHENALVVTVGRSGTVTQDLSIP